MGGHANFDNLGAWDELELLEEFRIQNLYQYALRSDLAGDRANERMKALEREITDRMEVR